MNDKPLTEALTEALEYLTTGLLTRADPDYMQRAIERAVRVLGRAMPGWTPPVPFPIAEPELRAAAKRRQP